MISISNCKFIKGEYVCIAGSNKYYVFDSYNKTTGRCKIYGLSLTAIEDDPVIVVKQVDEVRLYRADQYRVSHLSMLSDIRNKVLTNTEFDYIFTKK